MIVTCPNCSTKFNLPETQAAPGAKLRCSVCKHVFQLSDGVKPADRMQPTDQTRSEQAQPFDWSLVWLGGGILASAAAIALILRWLAAVRRTEKKNNA